MPQATLKRHLDGMNKHANGVKKLGRSTRYGETEWLKCFVEHVNPSSDKKVLLILDGHKTHTKHIEAIRFAHDHHIIMLSLPPHTTHKLQHLDIAFFKSPQVYFDQ